MARSPETQADDLDAVLQVREAGDLFEEHSEGPFGKRFRGTPLRDIWAQQRSVARARSSRAFLLRHSAES